MPLLLSQERFNEASLPGQLASIKSSRDSGASDASSVPQGYKKKSYQRKRLKVLKPSLEGSAKISSSSMPRLITRHLHEVELYLYTSRPNPARFSKFAFSKCICHIRTVKCEYGLPLFFTLPALNVSSDIMSADPTTWILFLVCATMGKRRHYMVFQSKIVSGRILNLPNNHILIGFARRPRGVAWATVPVGW